MIDERLGRIDLGPAAAVPLARLERKLVNCSKPEFTAVCDFMWPGGYAVLEALRLRARRRGLTLHLRTADDRNYSRPFSDVMGYGGSGGGSPTTIPLRQFDTGNGDKIGEFLLLEWAARAKILSQAATEYVVTAVAEVFENSLTHAASDVGVISCGQYFAKTTRLHLSVVDLGVGIPGSLAMAEHRREEDIDPARAIAWAFEPGTSSVRSSRGLGLATLRAFLKRSGATLHVLSGRGYAGLAANIWNTAALPARFPGTLVDIELPIMEVRPPAGGERLML